MTAPAIPALARGFVWQIATVFVGGLYADVQHWTHQLHGWSFVFASAPTVALLVLTGECYVRYRRAIS